ncbi:MAG: lysophospholipid acyltransferase family protein [Gallionella sp.]
MKTSNQTLPTILIRTIRLVLHLIYGVTVAVVYPRLNRDRQMEIQKNWSKTLLSIFNIPLDIQDEQFISCPDGCLQIANHVSWMDIFVLNAIQPSHFIAKSEVRDWPIIGWLCRRSGTLFIERASRQGATAISQQIVEKLRKGERIGLFPEGTTTDGRQVGTFRPSLLQSAIDANSIVSPVAICYQDRDGNLSSNAPFTGDTTLVESIWNMLSGRQIFARVTFAPPLQAGSDDRRALSNRAHQVIAHKLGTIGKRANNNATDEAEETVARGILSRPEFSLLFDTTLYQLPD